METYDPYNTMSIDYTKTRYKGAVVRCRLDMNFDETEAIRAALFPPDGKADAKAQYQLFGEKVLVEWNLVDAAKKSIPADGEGVLLAPPGLVRFAINTWGLSVFDVSAPLGDGSTPG